MKKNLLVLLTICLSVCFAACDKPVDDPKPVDPIEPPVENQPTKVLFETSMGSFTIMLYDATPLHKENFIKLVKDDYYKDVLFHRIIKNFMVQTGDPDSRTAKPGQLLGNGGPGYTIPAEFRDSLYHKRGAVAAARTGDQVNPQKASSGSQFYIVDGQKWTSAQLKSMENQLGIKFSEEQIQTYTTIGGVPYLDQQYTVFGEVIEGMDVIDQIASQQKDANDRPLQDIKIISTTIVK